jgi:ankyrin repeat protein
MGTRLVLTELPETIDEKYARRLREIHETDQELAHRLFQCVGVAYRPLRVEELAEFLVFDFDGGIIPKFREDWRSEDPVDAVLSKCSTLLAVVDVGDYALIEFSHFSVKEFLTSTRLAEACDTISRYHISLPPAHTLVAQACLGILLHLDLNVTRDSLQRFPLAEYAAKHWVDHVRFEGVSKIVEDGMNQLFDPNKPHLAVWVWIHDPGDSMEASRPATPFTGQTSLFGVNPRGSNASQRLTRRVERPLPPRRTPLHYAACCGFPTVVKFLVFERLQDVHSRAFDDESTPLHWASSGGHVEAARLLLAYGADVKAQDKNGSTPLHQASLSRCVELARLLIEHGADAAAQDNSGSTPLHQASLSGNVELANLLIERGVDVAAQDKNGSTPLHQASLSGSVELVRLLIKHGADAAAQDKKHGSTPLHLASRSGHPEVVQTLLTHGAYANIRDKSGWTPLHLASQEGHEEVVRLLLNYDENNGALPIASDMNNTN